MKKFFPIVAFIAVALISMTMAGFAYFATQEAARIKFEATADDALNRIESRIDLHLSLLRSTQALFDARNGEISRSEFKAFFSALDLDSNFAGLRGIGYLRLAKTGDEAAVERDMLRDRGVPHAVYPDTAQSWRTPVVLFEPLDPANESTIGYDMFTEPVRREAIEKAMTDDAQHASGLVQLGQGTGAAQTFTGFLVFVRLNVETAPDGINASRSSTSGFLYAAFRARDLFQTALSRTPLLPVNTEVYDGKVDADNVLFQSETPPVASFGDRLLVTRKIIVAGRPWTVLFRPTSAFSQPSSRAIPVMLGLFGLLLAGAIALVARYQERAYDAKSLLHETTEKSLLEKDLMLQEMKHRIKNSITRVLAIARQTAAHATDVKEFSSSFSARLQAMAASQDMLTRSRWQKADLGDLLRIELGQVFGKELPEGILSGPQVLLDETTTQALGLTFHELATNALKYGEAGNSVGALKVDWSFQGRGSDRMLVLNWREAGQKQLEAPVKTGFGTKLIDLNVTRELRGTIARDFRADGLTVEIRIPLPGTGKQTETG